MGNTNIKGPSVPYTWAAMKATRPIVLTLDSVRLDAKGTNRPQVLAHFSDASRVLVVTPSGSVMGTSLVPMGWLDAEELATALSSRFGWGEPMMRFDEVGK
jgi:hypothetical protein